MGSTAQASAAFAQFDFVAVVSLIVPPLVGSGMIEVTHAGMAVS